MLCASACVQVSDHPLSCEKNPQRPNTLVYECDALCLSTFYTSACVQVSDHALSCEKSNRN